MVIVCQSCGTSYNVTVTDQELEDWHYGMNIQNAMPFLSSNDRELLISRTCGSCFNKMFPPED